MLGNSSNLPREITLCNSRSQRGAVNPGFGKAAAGCAGGGDFVARDRDGEPTVFVWEIPEPGIPTVRVVRPEAVRVTLAPRTPAEVLTPLLLTVMRTPGMILKLFRAWNPIAPPFPLRQEHPAPSTAITATPLGTSLAAHRKRIATEYERPERFHQTKSRTKLAANRFRPHRAVMSGVMGIFKSDPASALSEHRNSALHDVVEQARNANLARRTVFVARLPLPVGQSEGLAEVQLWAAAVEQIGQQGWKLSNWAVCSETSGVVSYALFTK